MNYKSINAITASLTNIMARMKWLILMSAAEAFFAVGFVLGVARVVLGLHQEHRQLTELINLAKAELETIRIASGLTGSAAVTQEEDAAIVAPRKARLFGKSSEPEELMANNTYLSSFRTHPIFGEGLH